MPVVVNVNVGVVGHVDSGKTSLLRALFNQKGGVQSTAAFDKHPQSQQRGITLDLGFSSLEFPLDDDGSTVARVCFVDCPGHASLIRTVIGAAQIIDRIILVIDATKGVQAQTLECLVIAEILSSHLLIVLNKVDLLPPATRDAQFNDTAKIGDCQENRVRGIEPYHRVHVGRSNWYLNRHGRVATPQEEETRRRLSLKDWMR